MKLSKKLENMFSAIAFAEEGEFETARQMAAEDVGGARAGSRSSTTSSWQRPASSRAGWLRRPEAADFEQHRQETGRSVLRGLVRRGR